MPPDTMEASGAVCLPPPAPPRLAKTRRGARQVCWLDRWSDGHDTASQVLKTILGELQHYLQGLRHSTHLLCYVFYCSALGRHINQTEKW